MPAKGVPVVLLVVLFAGVAHADSLYVRLVGQFDLLGTPQSVDVAGNNAYVLDGDTLRVVSVVDPADPSEVGSCGPLVAARSVAVNDDYACVGAGPSLRVIAIADPTNPVEVGSCSVRGTAADVAIDGDYAYVAAGDSGLRVVSVADPANPVEVGHSLAVGFAYNVHVTHGLAFVAGTRAGLRIVSIADPANPTVVGYYYTDGGVNAVAADGEYVYVASAGTDSTFRVLSVADPANPVEVGQCYYFSNWPSAAPQDMKVTRGYAFLATWTGGLRIIDIADPTHPAEVGHYKLGSSWAVALDRRYVYFAAYHALAILQFYQLGDLDIDNDSLDVAADTLRPQRWATLLGESRESVRGELILANTSAAYNPDTIDGPSASPVDSVTCAGSLSGPGGTIDSIVITNLPQSFAQGQTMVCTLAAYVPPGLKAGSYTGSIYISGTDTAGLQVYESCYILVSKLGDIDVDDDSLAVVADTLRLPPTDSAGFVLGAFVLANTSATYNPDTADGPSLSRVDSLSFTGSLTGPGGTLDSIFVWSFPASLAQGQAVACTLAVYMPESLPVGDYAGSVIITGLDSVSYPVVETVHALVKKVMGVLGDLDVDDDSLDLDGDTMDLHTQPAGPVYHPYAKARFMLVNTSAAYNPDASDGPSQSLLREVKVEATVEMQGRAAAMKNGECRIVKYGAAFHSSHFTIDSSAVGIYVLNLPESLAVGQAVECTLAVVLPDSAASVDYGGWVAISATDTLGYAVRDSFFLTVIGPEPRASLDSLRVAPIPFKPYKNPEHDAIHFQGLSAGAKVIVYDASGQEVWRDTEKGNGHLKWKAEVASGIYVYLVVTQDGKDHVNGKLSVIR